MRTIAGSSKGKKAVAAFFCAVLVGLGLLVCAGDSRAFAADAALQGAEIAVDADGASQSDLATVIVQLETPARGLSTQSDDQENRHTGSRQQRMDAPQLMEDCTQFGPVLPLLCSRAHRIDRHAKIRDHDKIAREGRRERDSPKRLRLKNPRNVKNSESRESIGDRFNQKVERNIAQDLVLHCIFPALSPRNTEYDAPDNAVWRGQDAKQPGAADQQSKRYPRPAMTGNPPSALHNTLPYLLRSIQRSNAYPGYHLPPKHSFLYVQILLFCKELRNMRDQDPYSVRRSVRHLPDGSRESAYPARHILRR